MISCVCNIGLQSNQNASGQAIVRWLANSGFQVYKYKKSFHEMKSDVGMINQQKRGEQGRV